MAKKKRQSSSGRAERRKLAKQEAKIDTPKNQRWVRTADWALKKTPFELFNIIEHGIRSVDDYPIGPPEDMFSEIGTITLSSTDIHAITAVYNDKIKKVAEEIDQVKINSKGGNIDGTQ